MPALSEVPPSAAGGAARVLVGLSLEPPRQSRWSIFFRAVLAVPLFFVAFGLELGAFFVLIAAWFAALFTGRVPDGLQRFLTNVFRFYGNLLAYMFLLTSRWPGIVWDGRPDDQLTIEVDHVRLRRWAVFFRLLLALPAGLVNEVLSAGAYLMLFVMWCWGVVAGREPRALHQGMALVLRYQLRLFAYSCLLTPTQPFLGIFGDGVEPLPDPAGGAFVQPAATSATPTHWLMAKSAKTVVIVMLVIGAPIFLWQAHNNGHLFSQIKTTIARALVTSSYNSTVNAVDQFESTVKSCTGQEELTCVANAAKVAAPTLAEQLTRVTKMSFYPASAIPQVDAYEQALGLLETEMLSIRPAATVTAQASIVNTELPQTFTRFSGDYQALYDQLTN
jgi:hypothetical protein